jgi:hypothetical protein
MQIQLYDPYRNLYRKFKEGLKGTYHQATHAKLTSSGKPKAKKVIA